MANADGEKKRDNAMFRKKESFALGTGGKIFDSDIKKRNLPLLQRRKKSGCAPLLSIDFFSSDIVVFCAKNALFGEFEAL